MNPTTLTAEEIAWKFNQGDWTLKESQEKVFISLSVIDKIQASLEKELLQDDSQEVKK